MKAGSMDRRAFFLSGACAGVCDALGVKVIGQGKAATRPAAVRQPVLVRAGFSRKVDGTTAPLKSQQTAVRSFDSDGKLAAFVIPVAEQKTYRGAPLHVHHDVDEWIYILGGEFVAEVGGERIRLKAGDSLLMPMRTPHRWSIANTPTAGAIHLYTPAGLMDLSFDPTPDDLKQTPEEMKAMFEKYNMSLLGAPLSKMEIDAVV